MISCARARSAWTAEKGEPSGAQAAGCRERRSGPQACAEHSLLPKVGAGEAHADLSGRERGLSLGDAARLEQGARHSSRDRRRHTPNSSADPIVEVVPRPMTG